MEQSINLKRYLCVLLLILFSVLALAFLLEGSISELSSLLLPIILAPVGATWDAAGQFFKKYKTVPSKQFAWIAAFKMTLIEVSVGLLVTAVSLTQLPQDAETGTLITFSGVVTGLGLIFFFVSFGLKKILFIQFTKDRQRAAQRVFDSD